MPITFAKTRYKYDSYYDFRFLVEVCGFPTCYIDEMNVYDPEQTYIISPMNGEILDFMDEDKRASHKAHLVHWCLERPGAGGSIAKFSADNVALVDNGYFDEVVCSDKAMAEATGMGFVVLGSNDGLCEIFKYDYELYPGESMNKEYDLISLMCYSNTRGVFFERPDKLRHEFMGLSMANNGWGYGRVENLAKSKVMLTWHQDEFHYTEPLRLALAGAYRLPVISQYCLNLFPFTDIIQQTFSPGGVRSAFDNIMANYTQYAELMHYTACLEYEFRKVVEEKWK